MTSPNGDASGAETARLPAQDPNHLVRPYVSQAVAEPTPDLDQPGSVQGPVRLRAAVPPTRTAPAAVPQRSARGSRGLRRRPAPLVGLAALTLAALGGVTAGAFALLSGGQGDSVGRSGPMVHVPMASVDSPLSPGSAGASSAGSSAAPTAPVLGGPAPTATTSPDRSPVASGSAPGSATTGTRQRTGPGSSAAPPNGSNEALGATATDSGHTQTYTAGNAVDGQPDSYWESTDNAFPQSLTVDLGAVRTVGRLVLELPPLPAWNTRTETFSVLGGTGGSSFSTLLGPSGHTFSPSSGNTVTITLPAHPSARYLRLTFLGNTGWPAGQLSELQVYPS